MSSTISIYVHWPFCLSKCPYCDFNSHIASTFDCQAWLSAYLQELDYFSEFVRDKYISSIFFGGGTPSLMPSLITKEIIERISKLAIVNETTEITLEANPTSFEIDKFIEFKNAGVNRISIGVQALEDQALKILGREHNASLAKSAVEAAHKLFSNVSFDLIYARPHQKLEEWQKELKLAMSMAKGHLSLYQLTIEKGTAFFKLFREGKLELPANDLDADMYEWTTSYLADHSYIRYEISNYAQAGLECRHNLTYWHYNSYLGIGPGAHSRIINHKNKADILGLMMQHKPEKWLKTVEEAGCGIQSSNKLPLKIIIKEFLMMGLRLKSGVSNKNFQYLTNLDLQEVLNLTKVKQYQEGGLVNFSSDLLSLTDKGLMLHSQIVPRLLAD